MQNHRILEQLKIQHTWKPNALIQIMPGKAGQSGNSGFTTLGAANDESRRSCRLGAKCGDAIGTSSVDLSQRARNAFVLLKAIRFQVWKCACTLARTAETSISEGVK